jgi:hypothetical protein
MCVAYCQRNQLLNLLQQAEKEIHISMTDSKRKINIGRHCPRFVRNIHKHLDTPYFSLPTIPLINLLAYLMIDRN